MNLHGCTDLCEILEDSTHWLSQKTVYHMIILLAQKCALRNLKYTFPFDLAHVKFSKIF